MHLEGLPHLRGEKATNVRIGNALREVALTLAQAQSSVGETRALEQPATSLMLHTKSYKAMETATNSKRAARDQCCDGAPWNKSTNVSSNDPNVSVGGGVHRWSRAHLTARAECTGHFMDEGGEQLLAGFCKVLLAPFGETSTREALL